MHPPVATWSLTVQKSQPADIVVPFDLHVTNVALAKPSLTNLDLTTVLLSHEDLSSPDAEITMLREVTICWLSPCEVRHEFLFISSCLLIVRGLGIRALISSSARERRYVFKPQTSKPIVRRGLRAAIHFHASVFSAVDLTGYYFQPQRSILEPSASTNYSSRGKQRKRPRLSDPEDSDVKAVARTELKDKSHGRVRIHFSSLRELLRACLIRSLNIHRVASGLPEQRT